jgi:agmatine deiminase
MRDCAPFFLRRGERVEALGLRFNGWARYDNHRQDAACGPTLCAKLGIPFSPAQYNNIQPVLEGGAVESNGAGVLMVTEECLLSDQVQVRNPGWTRADYESFFRAAFGAERTLWLGKGIAGDDTHGHIDDLCRFVSARSAVLCREKNPRDANYHHLEENWERMQGTGLELIELPMPEPLYFDSVRLPASYANFYVTNGAVLVPTFNDPADRAALGVLAECFPTRRVVGIHAVDLIWGFGAIHCLTHEIPL